MAVGQFAGINCPIMEIQLPTARLKLTLADQQDLTEIHALHSLAETDRYNTLGIPENISQTSEILQGWIKRAAANPCAEYTFTIRERHTSSFVGLIALKCGNPKFRIGEVWYKLHVDHWRKGYATEALAKILDYGFNSLKLHRIEAGCAIANTGSIRVLEKAGMVKEGQKRKVLPLKDGWSDNYEFAMLEEDWHKLNL